MFSIKFDKMTPIGEVKFYFSEPLKAIEEFDQLNLDTISNEKYFKVLYSTYVESI